MAVWLLVGMYCIGAAPASPNPSTLSERIDHCVAASLQDKKIVAAPLADDAEFLRRIHLDLIGQIPSEFEVRQFLSNAEPGKRSKLIDRLLQDPRHAAHFARTWRALLLPEAETDLQVDYFRPGLEAWLRERREKNVGFDAIVRDLISVPVAGPKGMPEMVIRDLRRPNSLGYFAAKDAKPENIAASATRLFLGIRLECAQCHDHPSGHWTRRQFWNQAAFFGGLERRGKTVFSPLVEKRGRPDVAMAATSERVPILFLDGQSPVVASDESARTVLARWLTSPHNQQFSQATVNRVWGQLMGLGLVEPVDDFQDANPPSHPALLNELASSFVDSKFDLKYLMGAICRSTAYQRTSRLTHPSQDDPRSFSRMAVKQLSGRQFVQSLMSVLGNPSDDDFSVDRNRDPSQQQLLELFRGSEKHNDPQTSILQSLALMNGSVLNDALSPPQNSKAATVVAQSEQAIQQRVDSVYLAALSRLPSKGERIRLVGYVANGAGDERARRLGNVRWMVLNSLEFRCNH